MKKILFVICLLATGILFMPSAEVALIANGSFESGVGNPDLTPGFITLNSGNTSLTGWAIGGHSVDWIGSTLSIGSSLWVAADGARSIDLNGMGPGSISQTFGTIAGQTYEVRFKLSGNGYGDPDLKTLIGYTNDMVVAESFQFDTQSAGFPLPMGWTECFFTFTAIGSSSTLWFVSTTTSAVPGFTDNPFGPALDDVRVSAVPEPSTLLLLGSGLVGLIGYGRRRFRK